MSDLRSDLGSDIGLEEESATRSLPGQFTAGTRATSATLAKGSSVSSVFAAGTRRPPMTMAAWATLPAELPAPLGVIAPVSTVVLKGTRAPGVVL